MKLRKAVVWSLLVFAAYVLVLAWGEHQHRVFEHFDAALRLLPMLMAMSLLSYVLRYQRWALLLKWSGYSGKRLHGFMAYLSGFAFTATPGKVGELVRIRYLQPLGVPPKTVISTFIVERSLDLVAVLMLSLLVLGSSALVGVALTFVLIFMLMVLALASYPQFIWFFRSWLELAGFVRLAGLITHLHHAFIDLRRWSATQLLCALALGLLAWLVTSLSFLWLLDGLHVSHDGITSLGVYPLSMLVGAASMLPGGVGSTEAAIVVQLKLLGADVAVALLAAVAIRMGTMWFAIFLGFTSLLVLEAQGVRPGSVDM